MTAFFIFRNRILHDTVYYFTQHARNKTTISMIAFLLGGTSPTSSLTRMLSGILVVTRECSMISTIVKLLSA